MEAQLGNILDVDVDVRSRSLTPLRTVHLRIPSPSFNLYAILFLRLATPSKKGVYESNNNPLSGFTDYTMWCGSG